jgi:DNA-binding XRE family transcriptional regulator
MARRKFSGRHLRVMRQEAGFTQKQMARRLGISRETVVAIENEYPSAIGSLEIQLMTEWWQICRPLIQEDTRKSFIAYMAGFFGITE